MQLATRLLLSLSSIVLESRSVKDRLRNKMSPSNLSYSSDAKYQKRITMWNLNPPSLCLSKDDQALIIKKDGNRHNFSLGLLTRGGLMLMLDLIGVEKHKNSQMNCISWLLTALSIFSTLSSPLIFQLCGPRITSFLNAACFLNTRSA